MPMTGPIDTFARDNLPPRRAWPEFLLDLPELTYPERLNCVGELLDRWIAAGQGDRACLISPAESLTYAGLSERVNRIANVLTRDLGLQSGNRVLLRGPNNPMMVAAYLAVIKAGGIVVATMPLLRARELATIMAKAKIALALCDARLNEEMEGARTSARDLKQITYWGGDGQDALDALMRQPGYENFSAHDTAAEDVCLIAFTSGTTGEPKGCMHVHRDMLATCDTYGRHVLRASPLDRFVGSPPLAFTFGLGGLVLFPMRVGASAVLLEKAPPDELLAAIAKWRATACFTAPTAYRAMLGKIGEHDVSSLRKCVSAGEALPKATFDAWLAATGLKLMDGIGATEMLHIFIGSPQEQIRAGSTGKPVPGYVAKVIDDEGREMPPGVAGRLAVRGPTGCRYLADNRQHNYVQSGWNITGDTYVMDKDGYFWYQALRRHDHLGRLQHRGAGSGSRPARTCGGGGMRRGGGARRGAAISSRLCRAAAGHAGDTALTQALQEHVKATIAPFKYPRAIDYVVSLPRTQTGKLQRFELRRLATGDAAQKLAS